MRIEIVKPDENKIIKQLWNALYPLNATSKDIMVFMTLDGGKEGNERAMVISIKGLPKSNVIIR